MEGSPVQELAAIEVKEDTLEIVDVFHGYAYTQEHDDFARQHIHGLNTDFLRVFGYSSESILLNVFRLWLASKPNRILYCNDASKERNLLQLPIFNFNLLPWAERMYSPSHKIANCYKKYMIPVLSKYCSQTAHSSFVCAPYCPNPLARMAKCEHGFHCALYDVMELYFERLLQ